MIRFLAFSLAFTMLTIFPAPSTPDGFVYWSASDLSKSVGALPANVSSGRALETLATWVNHRVMLVYRPENGQAELHEHDTDFYIVQSGEGILVVGGELVGGETTGPGEIRGGTIRGAQKIELKVGDVTNIPSKTPHQVLVESGKSITYMIVKVRDR